ncbi:hypothetical protein BH09ACT7_BH09ACT7_08510 [soil metagenome]
MHRQQEDHADLGLIDDDNTEILTAPVDPSVSAPGGSRRDQSIRENRKA